jgi:SAM-dependent methyltransferase
MRRQMLHIRRGRRIRGASTLVDDEAVECKGAFAGVGFTSPRAEVNVDHFLQGRVERERAFWDALAKERRLPASRAWIARSKGVCDRHQDLHDYFDPRGKRVLDYGCGEGALTLQLLQRGAAHVTAFDISEGQVDVARARAAAHGLGDSADFLVADAHALPLADSSIELAVGVAILHHLELPAALRELRRILEPGGRAVFVEPLWHNPLLRAGRALTPGARTLDEHPLTVWDWDLCASVFPGFEHHERELTTILLMPLNLVLRPSAQRWLAGKSYLVDEWLLGKVPRLRRHARLSILILK